jgi:hypothetical protein
MVFTSIYNLIYRMNPFPKKHYMEDESQELNSLPDLSHVFSDHNMFGSPKKKMDPRFDFQTTEFVKKCMVNFAVYRECLLEHSDGEFDPDHPNATICKNFRFLARRTCPSHEVFFF